MKKTVYIETTIPSFYVETRMAPDMAARRAWTREWWREHRARYELVTSMAVIEELEAGHHPRKRQALEFIREVPLVPVVSDIAGIAEEYVKCHLMPANPHGDALHLALASYYHGHFLLTWNCQHLANANKFEHIRHVNAELGLFSPILTTPFELLGQEEPP